MNVGIELVFENVGMSFELTVLFAVTVGALIFFAVDWKLGLVLEFLLSGSIFMWFYSQGYNYAPALIAMFIWLILMSLTLYAVGKGTSQGQVI